MTDFNTVKTAIQEAANVSVEATAGTALGRSKTNYAACLFVMWLQDNDAPSGKDGDTVQRLFALTDAHYKAVKGALSSAALLAKRGSLPVDVTRKNDDGESVTVTVTLDDFNPETSDTLASVQTTAQAIRARDKKRREATDGASRMEVNAFEAMLERQPRNENGTKSITIAGTRYTDAQSCADGMRAALANGDGKAFQAFQANMAEGLKHYEAHAKAREAAQAALADANALANLSHGIADILAQGGDATNIALQAFTRMSEAVEAFTASAEKQAANG